MTIDKNKIFNSLKDTLNSYTKISDTTWKDIKNICKIREIKKNNYAFELYDNVDCISYVYKGLFRTVTTNEHAEEYTNNFFWENRFYGPMVALLTNTANTSSVQAIEDSIVIDINHTKYRQLLEKYEDLKIYHILYIEKHWIIQKDHISNALVLENAKARYQRFLNEFEHIVSRLSQYHIASYLGISPTHLSRIRKSLNQD
ncbi:Crp/Fnr family transcriptional regulator [Arcobacter sp. CECT 8985]|uniref:Crp/Fnr family transcriptional regulator n=1 Tax=Arcobacter sp. CECT 8985 TaxID=1935424 RepID=UPI00100B3C6D|nr:Crp/Fnr family transcriptional regulator [Arcobacter sp. CECT 8985]RXJ86495.1 cyclic nucleotide-binding protein [Arcobacter sp. CECT 8985]